MVLTVYYSGKRLYQYKKDDFFIQVFIVNEIFSNYKFTSNQREASRIGSSLDFYVSALYKSKF